MICSFSLRMLFHITLIVVSEHFNTQSRPSQGALRKKIAFGPSGRQMLCFPSGTYETLCHIVLFIIFFTLLRSKHQIGILPVEISISQTFF